jgi:hypothetical protein
MSRRDFTLRSPSNAEEKRLNPKPLRPRPSPKATARHVCAIIKISGPVGVPEAFAEMIFPGWGKRRDLACLAQEFLIGRV